MLKHNYHIEDLGRPQGWFKAHRYRYTCVRCGWAFLVENWSGKIRALASGNQPLPGPEGARRLATFVDGPCEPNAQGARRRSAQTSKPEPGETRRSISRSLANARIILPK
jgi:hypothetical protein